MRLLIPVDETPSSLVEVRVREEDEGWKGSHSVYDISESLKPGGNAMIHGVHVAPFCHVAVRTITLYWKKGVGCPCLEGESGPTGLQHLRGITQGRGITLLSVQGGNECSLIYLLMMQIRSHLSKFQTSETWTLIADLDRLFSIPVVPSALAGPWAINEISFLSNQ